MIRIRKAETADAESLALIGEQTFRETFGTFNTKKDMDEYCTKNFGTRIQQNEIADKNKCTLLYESDNDIIGYAQINQSAVFAGISDDSQAEIQRFYIVKDLHGKGAAQALMNAALDTVRRLNIKHVWLGVWEKIRGQSPFIKNSVLNKSASMFFYSVAIPSATSSCTKLFSIKKKRTVLYARLIVPRAPNPCRRAVFPLT